VKAGLNHAGWGGLLEFISAGKPMVTWPHQFDQHCNSDLICDQKAGVELWNERRDFLFD
jgi:UDP:flavonoid glycosyltransferase YjiC (YdhE family)